MHALHTLVLYVIKMGAKMIVRDDYDVMRLIRLHRNFLFFSLVQAIRKREKDVGLDY